MHDLRRRALESSKTVSRKAQSRQASIPSSRVSSAPSSRPASRAVSRNVSDDEEDSLSDGTNRSATSLDDGPVSEETTSSLDSWESDLDEAIDQLVDRKHTNTQGRADLIATVNNILTLRYARDVIEPRMEDVVSVLLRSVKSESSEREAMSALRALCLTILTMPSESVFEATLTQLKRTISHSSSTAVKSAAIRALGAVTFYGGASTTETQEVMEFFLEIIQSDGDFVNARDIAPVVVTALEEWGYLATQIEDMEGETASAIDSFVDQLDSADHSVQIAAGENIALLYEKSYSPLEEDEEVPQNAADESDPEDDRPKSSPKLIKRYTVYRQEHQLRQTLSSLASVSGRSISKKDKKSLHSNFSDILSTLDDPTRGPRYRAAVNNDTGKRYGSRLTVRIHRTGEMRIDTWWKLHRLKALRRVLQSGFINHYEHNSVVFDSLPIMISRRS